MSKRSRFSLAEGYHTCWNWMQTGRLSVPFPLAAGQMRSMLERLASVTVYGTPIEVHNRSTAVHYSNTSVVKLDGGGVTATLYAGDVLVPAPREFFIVPKSAPEYADLQDWIAKACEHEEKLQHNLAVLHAQMSSEDGVHPALAELLKPFWRLRVDKYDSTPGIQDLLKMLSDGLAIQTAIGMEKAVRPAASKGGDWGADESTIPISWVE